VPEETRWNTVWTHRDALLRVARRRTPNAADAEDCVSEAMLRAMLHEDFDPSRAAAFLTSVTVRLCADLHRDRVRTARLAARCTGDERLAATPEALACDRAEAAWLVRRATRGLTPLERAAVTARAEGDALPGVTPKAAGAALTRARAKARAHH
jgi:DNA-directed RNA polymerase specialized sigma24 family protein